MAKDKNEMPDDRITVVFDDMYGNAYVRMGPNAGKKIGTVTHFIEKPRKTPTGGEYISKQFTLRVGNRVWYGTCSEKNKDRKGRYIVRCRPKP